MELVVRMATRHAPSRSCMECKVGGVCVTVQASWRIHEEPRRSDCQSGSCTRGSAYGNEALVAYTCSPLEEPRRSDSYDDPVLLAHTISSRCRPPEEPGRHDCQRRVKVLELAPMAVQMQRGLWRQQPGEIFRCASASGCTRLGSPQGGDEHLPHLHRQHTRRG